MDISILILALIGLLAGMLGGLLGIGGSVLMIPAMSLIFGRNQHLYQGAAMMVNFFVAFPSVLQHRRARAILGPIVRVTIPTAVAGVVLGVWLSAGPWFRGRNEVYLSCIFGGFLFYVAAYNVYRLLSAHRLPDIDRQAAEEIPVWKIAVGVGLPTGIIAGLLGIGGGAVAVPLQQVVFRMPLPRAIANSATTILGLSIIGAAYKNFANAQAGVPVTDALKLALVLIPTGMIGGYLGGRLTHVLSRKVLRIAFILLVCYGGISMIRRPARAAEKTASIRDPSSPAIVTSFSLSYIYVNSPRRYKVHGENEYGWAISNE